MSPGIVPAAQVVTAFALALLAVGCLLILRNPFAALLAVAPMAIFVPWQIPIVATDMGVVFPLAASVVWLAWIAWERFSDRLRLRPLAWFALLVLAATAATVLSPQTLVLSSVIVVYYAAKRGIRPVLPVALAMVVAPAAYEFAIFAMPAYDQGRLLDPAWWLQTTISQGWDMRPWLEGSGGAPYRMVQFSFNLLFYVPMLFPFAVAAYECRRQWWFTPTFLWGATLVAGNLVFAWNFSLQQSLTMQMGVLVPFAVACVDRLRKPLGTAVSGNIR